MIKNAAIIAIAMLSASLTFAAEPNRQVEAVKDVQPEYPMSAIQRQQTGWAVIEYSIDENGKPTDMKVTESAPSRIFNRAALKALHQSRFEVTEVEGVPVKVDNQRRKFVFDLNQIDASSFARN